VTQDANTPDMNMSLALYGSISGRVVRNSDGAGLWEIQISVYEAGWQWTASALTDFYGNYTVDQLLAGSYLWESVE
jgi:hypothetical protein